MTEKHIAVTHPEVSPEEALKKGAEVREKQEPESKWRPVAKHKKHTVYEYINGEWIKTVR